MMAIIGPLGRMISNRLIERSKVGVRQSIEALELELQLTRVRGKMVHPGCDGTLDVCRCGHTVAIAGQRVCILLLERLNEQHVAASGQASVTESIIYHKTK